jgi:NAD(P)-dependent dehydrogenase (short-subunit alcohol dehydrogenase family)
VAGYPHPSELVLSGRTANQSRPCGFSLSAACHTTDDSPGRPGCERGIAGAVTGDDRCSTRRIVWDARARTGADNNVSTGLGEHLGHLPPETAAAPGDDSRLSTQVARKFDRCEEVALMLRGLGVRAIGMSCDVRDRDQIEAVVARTVEELGAVDILVSNSGTTWGAAPEEMPLEGWQKVLDVNLTGAFLFAQAAGREMIRKGRGGKIVNIASVTAFRRTPQAVMDAIPYTTSKGALIAFTTDLTVKVGTVRDHSERDRAGWFPSDLSDYILEWAGAEVHPARPHRRGTRP